MGTAKQNSKIYQIEPSLIKSFEGDISSLDRLSLDDESSAVLFSSKFWEVEKYINFNVHNEDVVKAKLKVISGRILLKAKNDIPHGSWSQFAVKYFDITEGERNIRMKAASIVGIENYFYLGWKRIKSLASAIKKIPKHDPFKDIMESISYTLDPTDPDDADFFKTLVDAYNIKKELVDPAKLNIKLETIVTAIENEVEFNKKLIDYLKKSGNPAVSLLKVVDYGYPDGKKAYKQKSKTRELILHLEKVTVLGIEAVNDHSSIANSLPGYVLEDAADVIGKLWNIIKEQESKKEIQL